jgi:hypothetical protein
MGIRVSIIGLAGATGADHVYWHLLAVQVQVAVEP